MLNGILSPGGGEELGWEDIQRRRKTAEALMTQGMDVSPVKHWSQALARALQGGYAGYEAGQVAKEEKAANQPLNDAIASYLRGQGGASPSPPPVAPSQSMTVADAGGGAPRAAPFSGSQGDFVSSMMPHAQRVAQETGLDPRLVIAQSALETGWGKSAPGNNFFGIKSHGQPGGNTLATSEVVNGQPVRTQDSFRTYAGMGESAAGYAEFLKANPRYRDVLSAQGLDAQIAAMAKSGYATDPAYGDKLRQIASGVQIPQGQPQQVASLDGLPPGAVASDAPPMALAGAMQAGGPPMPPMPPRRPESLGGAPNSAIPPAAAELPAELPPQQNQAVSAPNPPNLGRGGITGGITPPPQQFAQALNPGMQGQSDPRAALLAAALSGRASPQLRQTAMQLYQMGQKDQGVSPVDLGDRIALMNGRGQITGYLPKGRNETDEQLKQTQLQAARRDLESPAPLMVPEGTRMMRRDGTPIGEDQGSKIARESMQREAEAKRLGLDANDPRTKQFVLTGSYPKEPELTVTDKNAILEADDLVSANRSALSTLQKAKELSKKAMGFVGSGMLASVTAPFSQTSQDTVELNNVLTEQALGQLKAIFGGAPTEGERKILLDIQGSSSQPDAVRQKILDRAIEAAQKRMALNEDRAKGLRGRTYFTAPTTVPGTPQQPVSQTPTQAPAASLPGGWSVERVN